MYASTIKQIVSYLYTSNKSEFVLTGKTKEVDYTFCITDKIEVSISKDGINRLCKVYKSIDDIVFVDMMLTNIREVRYFSNGLIRSTSTRKLVRDADILLVLFKVLNEKGVFILEENGQYRVYYYINSRVMTLKSNSKSTELVETKLFTICTKKSKLVFVSSLPGKCNCSDFYSYQDRRASAEGKIFKNTKRGVVVK